jgi:hypothetical protein
VVTLNTHYSTILTSGFAIINSCFHFTFNYCLSSVKIKFGVEILLFHNYDLNFTKCMV